MPRDSGVSTLVRGCWPVSPNARVDDVLADVAVLELADHRPHRARPRPCRSAVRPPSRARRQALQHAHLDADQVGVEHAHQLVGRAGRVGQRPEDVEDRAHAQLFAHGRGMFFIAGWWLGANMKPMPVSGGGATCSGRVDAQAPRASSTSALPEVDETLRLPCFVWPRGRRRRGDEHRRGGDVEGVRRRRRRCRRCRPGASGRPPAPGWRTRASPGPRR